MPKLSRLPVVLLGLSTLVACSSSLTSSDSALGGSAPAQAAGGSNMTAGGGAGTQMQAGHSGAAGSKGLGAAGSNDLNAGGSAGARIGAGGGGGAISSSKGGSTGAAPLVAMCLGCLKVLCSTDYAACAADPSCDAALQDTSRPIPDAHRYLEGCGCTSCPTECPAQFCSDAKGPPSGGAGGSSAGGAGVGAGAGGAAGAGGSPVNASGGSGGGSGGGGAGPCPGISDCTGVAPGCAVSSCADTDGCAAACQDACSGAPPTLPIDGIGIMRSTDGHANQFDPACASSLVTGPDVAYTLVADKDGILTVTLSPAAADMVLSLRQLCKANQPDVICKDDAGAGGAERLSLPVKAGDTWTVIVGGASAGQSGVFALRAEITAVVCGDGVVDITEQCDDGAQNGAAGDFCSAACTIVACDNALPLSDPETPSLKGQTTGQKPVLHPSCSLLGSSAPQQIYQVRAVNTGRLEIRLAPEAGVDLGLSVRSSCQMTGQELGCVDGAGAAPGAKNIERLSVPVVAGQSLFIAVTGYTTDQQGSFQLDLRSYPTVCGDKIVSGQEQCEPGLDPTGCTADCVDAFPAGAASSETEPNDTAASASPYVAPFYGAISPAGDQDLIRVDVPGPASSLTAAVTDFGTKACAGEKLDSYLELLGPDGATVLAHDDDGGAGYCSLLTATGLGAGSYYLRVRASPTFAPRSVFAYELDVAVK